MTSQTPLTPELATGRRPAMQAIVQFAAAILAVADNLTPAAIQAFIEGFDVALTHALDHPEHAAAWKHAYDAEMAEAIGRSLEQLHRGNRKEAAPFLTLFQVQAVTELEVQSE
jgi:hypothetical protein